MVDMSEFLSNPKPEVYADFIPTTRDQIDIAMKNLTAERESLESELAKIEKERQSINRDTLLGTKTFLQATFKQLGLDKKENKIKLIKTRLAEIEALLAQYSIQFQGTE